MRNRSTKLRPVISVHRLLERKLETTPLMHFRLTVKGASEVSKYPEVCHVFFFLGINDQ